MNEHCFPLYRWGCPNGEHTASAHRLYRALPCVRCLPSPPPLSELPPSPEAHREHLVRELRRVGTLVPEAPLARAVQVDRAVAGFRDLFRACVGARPWHIQETWARRVWEERSFAMIAPTGVGKTTFGAIMALFWTSHRRGRTVIILPTVSLVRQVEGWLREWAARLPDGEGTPDIVALHSRLSAKARREARARVEEGRADILVITAAFLRRTENIQLVQALEPTFLFVDDVDAVLKSGRVVDGVLAVLGVSGEMVTQAQEVLRLRNRLPSVRDPQRRSRLWARVEELHQRLRSRLAGRVLVVSSATGYPRGRRVLLFRELFGFEIGGRTDVARNIVDVAWVGAEAELLDRALALLPQLGSGGLVFVPRDEGNARAHEVAEAIGRRTGLRAAPFTAREQHVLDAFAAGEIDVLVGVASPYGVMVRGLDLPERVRYALFLRAPRHVLPLSLEAQTPANLARLFTLIPEVAPPEMASRLRTLALRLRQTLRRYPSLTTPQGWERLSPSSPARRVVEEALAALREFMALPDVHARLLSHPYILVRQVEDRLYIYLPDWSTYIQASGRTSRLFLGGITRGLSLVLESEERLLRGLERRLALRLGEFAFVPLAEVDLARVLAQVDEDRARLRRLRSGTPVSDEEREELARTALVIVESPNKARTIAHFFGRPGVQEMGGLRVYETSAGRRNVLIAASGGHVYDLAVDDAEEEQDTYGFSSVLHGVGYHEGTFFPVYTAIKRCQTCGYQFTDEGERCPICGSPHIRDARRVVRALRRLVLEVEEVYIATDPDTEGEKIAFDLTLLLAPLHPRIHRMEFHEVTPRAIREALEHPRALDIARVEAQIVRRVDDRWLGFTLSHAVTRAFSQGFVRGRPRLSAGRVQTPVLGWVIERYEEHERSKERYLVLSFPLPDGPLGLRILLRNLARPVRAGDVLDIRARVVGEAEEALHPRPPYTTDALIYESVRYLGLEASQVMQLAQHLFEWGLITYHRTDSTHVAPEGIRVAREYLREYEEGRYFPHFRPRPWGDEGAHEAIRPTRPVDGRTLQGMVSEGILDLPGWSREHARVYDLIFRRFIASQMAPVSVVRQRLHFWVVQGQTPVWEGEEERRARGEEEGFLHFYPYPYAVSPSPLPPEWEGTTRVTVTASAFKVLARVPLFTTGDLVRLMRERGIGRPSTYHKIVDTLLKRRYVRPQAGGGLVPTKRGREVYTFLMERYGDLVSEQATRALEAWMDAVVEGKATCDRVLQDVLEQALRVEMDLRDA